MKAFMLVFLAKACFKVVVRSVKIGEVIVSLPIPAIKVLPYLMIFPWNKLKSSLSICNLNCKILGDSWLSSYFMFLSVIRGL